MAAELKPNQVPDPATLLDGGGEKITYLTIGQRPVALVYRPGNLPLRAVGFDFETGQFKQDATLFLEALEHDDVWDSNAEQFTRQGEALLEGASGNPPPAN